MTVCRDRLLPPFKTPIINADGSCHLTWYKFFEDMHNVMGGDGRAEIDVSALPNPLTTTIESVSGLDLTASDAGSDVTIDIAAGSRTVGSRTITIEAGSVTGLTYSTLYYVYYRDPNRAGGAVNYLATTDASLPTADTANVPVGNLTTPAASAPPIIVRPLDGIVLREILP